MLVNQKQNALEEKLGLIFSFLCSFRVGARSTEVTQGTFSNLPPELHLPSSHVGPVWAWGGP